MIATALQLKEQWYISIVLAEQESVGRVDTAETYILLLMSNTDA